MTDTKKQTLDTIGAAMDHMTDNERSYMLGLSEGMALSKGLIPTERKEDEDEHDQ